MATGSRTNKATKAAKSRQSKARVTKARRASTGNGKPLQRPQSSPVPKKVLAEHAGSWVALRGRKVVAQAEGASELFAMPAVDDTVVTMFVPESAEQL